MALVIYYIIVKKCGFANPIMLKEGFSLVTDDCSAMMN